MDADIHSDIELRQYPPKCNKTQMETELERDLKKHIKAKKIFKKDDQGGVGLVKTCLLKKVQEPTESNWQHIPNKRGVEENRLGREKAN